MPNPYGRAGAPMIQPTKDEYRGWLREERQENKALRQRCGFLERRLAFATQTLGELVQNGKIVIPTQKLGELALQMAIDAERERSASASQLAPQE